MIKFPTQFVAIRDFPGYFWNTDENCLYSLKIGGVLRPLLLTAPNTYNDYPEPAYRISMKGRRKVLFPSRINNELDYDYTMPIAEKIA